MYSDVEEINTESDDSEVDPEDLLFVNATDTYPFFNNKEIKKISRYINNFKLIDRKDEDRVWEAYQNGGKECTDQRMIDVGRAVARSVVVQIGRKILNGDFNLTTISFPIKSNFPKTGLETAMYGSCQYPYFMNIAASITDPVERMKLLIVATFCNFPIANKFLKPMNPVIGETYQGYYIDGTQCYAEQICHHPPISYYYLVGKGNKYKASGYYLVEVTASLNSVKMFNPGKRKVVFEDGQEIKYNFGTEHLSGAFWGHVVHQSMGKITFEDQKNKIKCVVNIGNIKGRPSDYTQADLTVNGQTVSKLYGSYIGFFEWDGKRYWDHRDNLPFQLITKDESEVLKSDQQFRLDKIYLLKGNMSKAQRGKEKVEIIQREDQKLRKEYKKKKLQQLKQK